MALTTTKAITVTGQSMVIIDGIEQSIVTMSANIKESGHSNVTTTIIDQEKYDANKEVCRADIYTFTAYVREIEDSQSK